MERVQAALLHTELDHALAAVRPEEAKKVAPLRSARASASLALAGMDASNP